MPLSVKTIALSLAWVLLLRRIVRACGPTPHALDVLRAVLKTLVSPAPAALVIGTLMTVFYYPWNDLIRTALTAIVHYTSIRAPNDFTRKTFADTLFVKQRAIKNHNHGISAAHRSSATLNAKAIALALGRTPVFIQRSPADERRGDPGTRTYYWTKDTQTKPATHHVGGNDVRILIDVDYYIDMAAEMNRVFTPILIYTFQPDDAAAHRGDYSFTFNADSSVNYVVSGGASYSHHVWNYSSDTITAVTTRLGVPTCTSTYLVDKRRISQDHYLIMLTPLTRQESILGACATSLLDHHALRRLDPIDAGFIRLRVVGKDSHCVSTARIGNYSATTTTVAIDDYLATISSLSKHDLSMPSAEAALGPCPDDKEGALERKRQAAVVTAYHREKTGRKPDVVYPVEDAIRRVQHGQYTPDAKPLMETFMSPFIHEAYAPDRTVGNEEQAVRGRIVNVRSDPEITPHFLKLIEEFTVRVVPEPGVLHPDDYTTVREKQNRPTQRRILDESETQFGHNQRIAKSFMKAEVYAKATDPRLITTINGPDKREYSAFMYPLADFVSKTNKWYSFSRTPEEVAERVAAICSGASFVCNTDFSRFDGTINPLFRVLERAILMRAFVAQFRPQLADLHGAQSDLRGITRLGVRYLTLAARLSGSSETSIFNTICNAFSAYAAIRATKEGGSYVSPDEAWARLDDCLFGGDDGLISDVDPDIFSSTCAQLGLTATVDPIYNGKFGVTFLARIYGPDVWTGDKNSCCDILRQLGKFHATVPLTGGVKAEEKLLAKATAFVLSDANTPIIGPFCQRVVELSRLALRPEAEVAAPYLFRYDKEDQYPNDASMWIDNYVFDTGLDIPRFQNYLDNAWTIEKLLSPPLLMEPAPNKTGKVSVVIDGETHLGEEPLPLEDTGRSKRGRKPRPPADGDQLPAKPPRPSKKNTPQPHKSPTTTPSTSTARPKPTERSRNPPSQPRGGISKTAEVPAEQAVNPAPKAKPAARKRGKAAPEQGGA